MRIKPAVKYQINEYISQIRVYYISIFGVTAFFGLLSVITESSGMFSFGGYEFLTSIVLFIIGLFSFKEMFLMMLQNGISRKTMFIGRLISVFTISVIMAVIDRLFVNFGRMLEKINDKVIITGLYEMIFRLREAAVSRVVFNLEAVLITVFAYISVILLGFFIGTAYYRMNKVVKIAVSAGVPSAIFILLPLLNSMTDGKLFKLINKLLNFVFSSDNPYNMLLSCALFIVVCTGLSWLLIKNAVEKR